MTDFKDEQTPFVNRKADGGAKAKRDSQELVVIFSRT